MDIGGPPQSSGDHQWLQGLQPETQGRLRACTTPDEALQVLNAALGSGDNQYSIGPFFSADSVMEGAGRLLSTARRRAQELEDTLHAEQRDHEVVVARLKREQRRHMQRSLRRLVAELDPPKIIDSS